MIRQPLFYRQYGVRRLSDLKSPPVASVVDLKLPLASIAHHISYTGVDMGPEPTGSIYAKHSGRVLVEHITTLHEPIGNPKLMPGANGDRLAREYHKRYLTFRPLRDFEKSIREAKTLVIENYALLNQMYRYMKTMYSNIYKWQNIISTVFHNIAQKTPLSDRHHYLMVNLPTTLPSIHSLNLASKDITSLKKELIEYFAKPEMLIILEVWKWLGKPIEQKQSDGSIKKIRPDSLINMIPFEELEKVNLLWVDGGSWFVINLAKFVELEDLGSAEEAEGSSQTQRRFLRMLISLMGNRSETIIDDSKLPADDVQTDQEVQEDVIPKDQVKQKQQEKEVKGKQIITGNPYEDEYQDIPEVEEIIEDDVIGYTDEEPADDLSEDELNKDLEALNKIANRVNDETSIQETPVVIPRDTKSALISKIEKLADTGSMSAAEYRRAQLLASKTDDLPNPFGEGKLAEFTTITEEDLTFDDKITKIPEMKGVLDKSMLESSLNALDSQYIEKVMRKDILRAGLAVQRAGVIVTDVKKETYQDVGNNFEMITMKLNPIDGDSGVIRFRYPVVDEERHFMANGITYHMKKQKSDLPIRKISPSEVALSTYYAKAFVLRSDKSVVNYPKWLGKHINLLVSGEIKGAQLTGVKRLNVFHPDAVVPRIYSVMAQHYRELTIDGKLRLYFDYNKRLDVLGNTAAKAEDDGLVVCGFYDDKPVVVDYNNVFYTKWGSRLTELGTIESLLKLQDKTPPVEIAEFKLFTRLIPVGIALGYHYGLKNLLKLLNVQTRRVPTGQSLNMDDSEFAIRFADDTLIVSRSNKVHELILGGFNRFHQSLKQYNIDAFNNKDVFVNVMEDNGLRIGFIRELELAFDMFVDPVSEDILKEMNEPTTLEELLVRSCEMLTTDHHQDEIDEQAMRYRTYERFSGAVYAEMIKAVRQFRSRGAGKAAKITMNPEAVWQNIVQDSSVSPIEESNPIQNLKEEEIFTFGGTGGRSARSMAKSTRKYHKNSVGVVSEATVDSGMVGVNAYLSANPRIANLRGIPSKLDKDAITPSNLLSTSALISPASEHDDQSFNCY